MSAATPSASVLALIAGLVEDRAGLHYRDVDRAVLAEKLDVQARDLGYDSLLDYYYFLRYDADGPAELDRLIETLVVGETYFFRERPQLEVIVSRFLEPAARAGRMPRVWSAACATGEEPLSLAMMLAERGILDDVRIVASDLSQRALDRAQAGRFGRRSLRDSAGASWAGWTRRISPDKVDVEVDRRLVEAITWRRVNLSDDASVRALGTFDVILCRNVLIYFSDSTVTQVAERLRRALAPRGALFVGVSESLFRIGAQLVCEEQSGVFYYRSAT